MAVALATLANNTGILVATDVVDARSFLLSVEGTYAIAEQTVDEGPIQLYWAHSDYSLVEIEQFIEQSAGWGRLDEIQMEISKRKIRQIGVFAGKAASEDLNDGNPLKTSLKFSVGEGQGLNLVAYNNSGAALTGGATVTCQGHAWIKPT